MSPLLPEPVARFPRDPDHRRRDRPSSVRRLVASLCIGASAVALAASSWLTSGVVRTEDRNGDGRPDLWRAYDAKGQLVAVAIDTNFDGRSDVHEYYARGELLRRESDRNFNDRIDLVEDFDPATHEHVRSVFDADDDGTADLLVLFQGGQPVFSKWAPPASAADLKHRRPTPEHDLQSAARNGDDPLSPLTDPFRTDTTAGGTSIAVASDACVGLSASAGLPRPGISIVCPLTSALLDTGDPQPGWLATLDPHSPRGPPVPLS